MSIYNYGAIAQNSMAGLANTIDRYGQLKQQQEQQQAQQQAQQSQQQAAESDMQAVQGLSDLYANNASAQELYEYGLSNPAAYRMVQDAIGFKNDQTKQLMSDTLISAMQNPEQKDAIITKGVQDIAAVGGNPQYLAQSIGDDFGEFERDAIPFLSTLGDQGAQFAKSYMDMKPKAPKDMSEFEKAKIEGKKADQELRRLEIDQRKLEAQQKRETNDIKRKETQQRIDENNAKKEEIRTQDKDRIDSEISLANENINSINEFLKNDDYIDSVSGFANYSKVPESLRTTTQNEAAAYLDNIKNSLTLKNLGVMSGPLTDKDIQVIASASSRLREGMSEDALRKELNTINSAYDRVVSNYKKEATRKGYETNADQLSDYDLLSKYL